MAVEPQYWFPAKRRASGWGLPCAWQGWAVVATFFCLVLLGALVLLPTHGSLRSLLTRRWCAHYSWQFAGSRANARAGGEAVTKRDVLVTGGTGYIGSPLISTLVARGHRVRALARSGAVGRVPAGAQALIGDALDASSVAGTLRAEDTLVHLIGTPHPNPSKAEDFVRVDLASVRASVDAARRKGAAHYVYVSVAQPAPVMKAYVAARAEAETLIRNAKLTATVLRPWYVLGPGHRWPLLLTPVYALAALVPSLRDGAQRMGLVTLTQMVAALAHAVENPPAAGTLRVVEVPEMRTF